MKSKKPFNNRIFKSIILIITMIILNIQSVHSYSNFYDLEKITYETMSETFHADYNNFVSNIGISDSMNIYTGWSRFRPLNDKLIIGASAVVHCGSTLENDIDYYGYDILGYGGICDDKIKEWIPHINKKYKKIILFEGVNTINILCINKIKTVPNEAYDSILTTIAMLGDLLVPGGEIIYVKVKPMTYDRDAADENFVKRFNSLAAELNNTFTALNIKLYEIPYDTTVEYSSGYVHYSNRIVWNDMLSQ